MKNTIIRGSCRAYSNEGAGIVNSENLTIFVNGLFLGEEADIELTYTNNKIGFGKVKKLHSISPDRIEMLCPVGTSCGGCCFQALKYEKEVEFKKDRIVNAFSWIAHMDVKLSSFFEAPRTTFYRNKIQVPFGLNNFGKLTYGFFKAFSHEIVPFKKCYIESDIANNIVCTIRAIMLEEFVPAYNEQRCTGVVRHVAIRTSNDNKHVMVTVVTSKHEFKNKDFFFRKILRAHPEITSLIQNVNSEKTNVILGEREYLISGVDYIEDSLLGITLRIGSKSFYQVNHDQCERLYSEAIEMAKLTGKEIVLDAYCGVGSIGLCLAKNARKVIGIEIVKEAIKNANINKEINNIKNIEFYAGDVEQISKKLTEKYDVIFVDPPRKGLDVGFKNTLKHLSAKKIIYISCDPNTLARDVNDLSELYELKDIRGVDLFPRTYHVETIVLLERKE